MISSTPSAYARAELYDALHGPDAPGTARWLARLAISLVPDAPRALWYEPGCGSGRLLMALARVRALRDARFVGVDSEPAMVRLARRRIAEGGWRGRVSVRHGDMREFGPRAMRAKVGVAFCLDNSIRHLPSDVAMLGHLSNVARLLSPEGAYVVGLGLSAVAGDFPSEDVVERCFGGKILRQVFNFIPPEEQTIARGARAARIERAYVHLSVTTRSGAPLLDESSTYGLRTYMPDQWWALVRRAGLRETAVLSEDGRDLSRDRSDGQIGYALRVLRRR